MNDAATIWNIRPGHSLREWDSREQPILLGSVFDANSLGTWIYDETVYLHGPGIPVTDMAGELGLMLIQLRGKLRVADDTMIKIKLSEERRSVSANKLEDDSCVRCGSWKQSLVVNHSLLKLMAQ